MAILEVKDIHKSFGSNNVLKGIDFELEEGRVLSIIGSSGSGKTTLAEKTAVTMMNAFLHDCLSLLTSMLSISFHADGLLEISDVTS